MIRSESRKSSLFSSLKSRKSLKDLTLLTFKTSSSAPSPNTTHIAGPLTPANVNAPRNKRLSMIGLPVSEDQENAQMGKQKRRSLVDPSLHAESSMVGGKRHTVIMKKKGLSPASEVTLATVSTELSEMKSLDSCSISMTTPSPTISHSGGVFENDLFPSQLDFSDYADYFPLADQPSLPTKIRRTTNHSNISRFLDSGGMLPISNRKSLEFEAHEISALQSRIGSTDDDIQMRLVENAFFMTFYQREAGARFQTQARFWDELDVDDVLKHDSDDSILSYTQL